jgi:hypothetical protein
LHDFVITSRCITGIHPNLRKPRLNHLLLVLPVNYHDIGHLGTFLCAHINRECFLGTTAHNTICLTISVLININKGLQLENSLGLRPQGAQIGVDDQRGFGESPQSKIRRFKIRSL